MHNQIKARLDVMHPKQKKNYENILQWIQIWVFILAENNEGLCGGSLSGGNRYIK